MAASSKHVLTNVERMAGDDELLKLWNRQAQARNEDDTERTTQQAWVAFVQAADEAKIADRIPGTTGKTFKSKYAADPKPEPKAPAKTTPRKASAKKAAGQ